LLGSWRTRKAGAKNIQLSEGVFNKGGRECETASGRRVEKGGIKVVPEAAKRTEVTWKHCDVSSKMDTVELTGVMPGRKEGSATEPGRKLTWGIR